MNAHKVCVLNLSGGDYTICQWEQGVLSGPSYDQIVHEYNLHQIDDWTLTNEDNPEDKLRYKIYGSAEVYEYDTEKDAVTAVNMFESIEQDYDQSKHRLLECFSVLNSTLEYDDNCKYCIKNTK